MPGPGLIAAYLDALARQLPGPVVEDWPTGWRRLTGGTWAWAWPRTRRRRLPWPSSVTRS